MSLKEKMKKQESIAGMHISLADSSATEICASTGYDFLWIDTEHAPIDRQILLHHLVAAHSGGTQTLVRVGWNDPVMIKQVLELGPDGVIVPMVNNVKELDRAMASMMYPPQGIRGFGPLRAVGYGLESAQHYIETINERLCRCVQVESEEAVNNLAEMVKNPWVDAFILGPCDLSGSIGMLGEIRSPRVVALIDRMVKTVRDAGKTAAVSTGDSTEEALSFWQEKGFNMISAGADFTYVLEGALSMRKKLASVQSQKQAR